MAAINSGHTGNYKSAQNSFNIHEKIFMHLKKVLLSAPQLSYGENREDSANMENNISALLDSGITLFPFIMVEILRYMLENEYDYVEMWLKLRLLSKNDLCIYTRDETIANLDSVRANRLLISSQAENTPVKFKLSLYKFPGSRGTVVECLKCGAKLLARRKLNHVEKCSKRVMRVNRRNCETCGCISHTIIKNEERLKINPCDDPDIFISLLTHKCVLSKYKCPYCNEKFTVVELLMWHIDKCSQTKDSYCEWCDENVSRQQFVMFCGRGKCENEYRKCDFCGENVLIQYFANIEKHNETCDPIRRSANKIQIANDMELIIPHMAVMYANLIRELGAEITQKFVKYIKPDGSLDVSYNIFSDNLFLFDGDPSNFEKNNVGRNSKDHSTVVFITIAGFKFFMERSLACVNNVKRIIYNFVGHVKDSDANPAMLDRFYASKTLIIDKNKKILEIDKISESLGNNLRSEMNRRGLFAQHTSSSA